MYSLQSTSSAYSLSCFVTVDGDKVKCSPLIWWKICCDSAKFKLVNIVKYHSLPCDVRICFVQGNLLRSISKLPDRRSVHESRSIRNTEQRPVSLIQEKGSKNALLFVFWDILFIFIDRYHCKTEVVGMETGQQKKPYDILMSKCKLFYIITTSEKSSAFAN